MTYAIANKPYELSMDQLIYGLDKLGSFYMEGTKESNKKGKNTELYLVNILKLLDFNEIYLIENGTILDSIYKIDIAVKYRNQWLGFQIKSGQYKFNRHKITSSIGVVQCTSESNSLKLLIELSKWLDVPIRDEVKSELNKWREFKQFNIKSRTDRRCKLFNLDWKLLTLLKLVRFNGEVLIYN